MRHALLYSAKIIYDSQDPEKNQNYNRRIIKTMIYVKKRNNTYDSR